MRKRSPFEIDFQAIVIPIRSRSVTTVRPCGHQGRRRNRVGTCGCGPRFQACFEGEFMSAVPPEQPQANAWPTLTQYERRALGVLVEKAKTTPDAYPLSLNSMVTGCNQKSNRDPLMHLNDS